MKEKVKKTKRGERELRGAACPSGTPVKRLQRRELQENVGRLTFAEFGILMVIFEERHGPSLFDRYRRFGERIGFLFLFEWWSIWDRFKRDVQEQNGHTQWLEQHRKSLLTSGWLVNLVWESLWVMSGLAMTTVCSYVRGD